MNANNLEKNKNYYIVNYDKSFNEKGRIYNAKNYEVLIGTVTVEKNKIIFNNAKYGELNLHDNVEFFINELEAESYKYKMIYEFIKDDIINKVKENNLPGNPIAPNFAPIISSNPLRFGERNVCFASQTNTFGNEKNEQKILQLLGVTYEDLIVLMNIFALIPFINDYSKKLLGKFTVVELNNIFNLLNNLKTLNIEYSNNEFNKNEL